MSNTVRLKLPHGGSFDLPMPGAIKNHAPATTLQGPVPNFGRTAAIVAAGAVGGGFLAWLLHRLTR